MHKYDLIVSTYRRILQVDLIIVNPAPFNFWVL